MRISEVGVLAGLALADSTSVGTLVIPVWLLLGNRFQVRRILLYLVVVAGFYWSVSLLLLTSMTRLTSAARTIHLVRSWFWLQLAIGAIVLVIGIWVDRKPGSTTKDPSRTERWRDRTLRVDGDRAMIGLALTAGLLELPTMVPLLTALGVLERRNLPPLSSGLAVTGYVALMMLPAGLLVLARVVLGGRMTEPLAAIGRRLEQLTHAFTAAVLMVVGGLLAADAAIRLGLMS